MVGASVFSSPSIGEGSIVLRGVKVSDADEEVLLYSKYSKMWTDLPFSWLSAMVLAIRVVLVALAGNLYSGHVPLVAGYLFSVSVPAVLFQMISCLDTAE